VWRAGARVLRCHAKIRPPDLAFSRWRVVVLWIAAPADGLGPALGAAEPSSRAAERAGNSAPHPLPHLLVKAHRVHCAHYENVKAWGERKWPAHLVEGASG
jgi:hypothetical protein